MGKAGSGRPWSLVVYQIFSVIAAWGWIANSGTEFSLVASVFLLPAIAFGGACLRERGRLSAGWIVVGVAAALFTGFFIAFSMSGIPPGRG